MSLKTIVFFFLSFIICTHTIVPSIISGTIIKTPHGHVTTEDITISDQLTSYDHHHRLSTTKVSHISTANINTLITITTQKGSFYACPDQQFFDPVLQKWIAAKNITTKNIFLDAQFNHCPCLNTKIVDAPETTIYNLSTVTPHNFFATEQELLTHNIFPIFIGIAWTFSQGLNFAGITIGTAILGSHIGVQLYKAQKQKAVECNVAFHTVPCVSPCPDPDDDGNDDKNLFKSIKLKADKKMRHKRFGNFYRDPESKLWWSKDNANHGGSAFKVFKETAKGLEWTFDANEIGHQIIGKHKGPVGLFISYKEFVKCP